jgi:integrase
MAPYKRKDSPFWWLCLERGPGKPPFREHTLIPIDGGTPQQTKANAALAQQAYAARMVDLARHRYRLPGDHDSIRFLAFRTWYAEHISTTKRGVIRERCILRKLGEYFDTLRLAALDTDCILEWRTARAKEVGPSTVNRELILLKHLLGKAIPKYLETNPAKGVTPLRVPEAEVRLLSPDEELRLLAVCTPEQQAVIICALDTLQRLSNVAGLRRAQDHGAYLTVLNPKVKGYKVPVSARLRKALDALPRDSVHYFPSLYHHVPETMRYRTVKLFGTLLEKASLPRLRKAGGLSFHCLRHTGASRMLARGVDIKTVQQLGGWKDITVLQRYLHPTDAQRRAAVEMVSVTPT